ncbi:hypothetical protein BSL78_01767 [Apostichopus japonicus]|uniref:Uncharacterized protein n=1 Tax=Stichopus japonicus TaxID=307972 RepID=A0A2G8LLZ1_STIJA|nr:hypothetical protein BSL78_01767 [Apostichopus japonicus]
MEDKTNYCDDENEQMMAVPCHPAPYMVTDHPQPSMTAYPVTHIPQQFAPIPQLFPSNSQSTLTPTVEPFYPSLHVYMHPATAPSNTMQTISNTSFTPSTTSLGHHCTPVSTASGMVPDQERRILSLEKQLKEAVKELTFFGDRNWRMEAYIDCLVHTLRKMDVTTVIDLNQKMLSDKTKERDGSHMYVTLCSYYPAVGRYVYLSVCISVR